MGNHRRYLAAIVAIWMTNGHEPVDGANDPREFIADEWVGAFETTRDLVSQEYLAWADPEEEERRSSGGGTYSIVIPTTQGLFEVLS